MILTHCVEVLNGQSHFCSDALTSEEQLFFKLQSGVTIKTLDSVKSALMMIEIMKVRYSDSTATERADRLNNFIEYAFNRFPEHVAMGLVKYAIRERTLNVPGMAKLPTWDKIGKAFKPVMMENSTDPEDQKTWKAFCSFYDKLVRNAYLSATMNEFVVTEVDAIMEAEVA